MIDYMDYIYKKYGKDFAEKCKLKPPTHASGKRLLVPVKTLEEVYEVQKRKRKRHPKYSYNCQVCGRHVITGFKIYGSLQGPPVQEVQEGEETPYDRGGRCIGGEGD